MSFYRFTIQRQNHAEGMHEQSLQHRQQQCFKKDTTSSHAALFTNGLAALLCLALAVSSVRVNLCATGRARKHTLDLPECP